jgi:hypothetical protein
MPIIDVDLAGWLALRDRDARRLAEGIARATDSRPSLLPPHADCGRRMRPALFRRGDVLFSLVRGARSWHGTGRRGLLHEVGALVGMDERVQHARRNVERSQTSNPKDR